MDACNSSHAAVPVPPSPLAPGRTPFLVPCCYSAPFENPRLLPATEDSALRQRLRRLLWPLLTSLPLSRPVTSPVVRFAQTGAEISQGKSCHVPSVPAGSTLVCVRVTIGPPRPMPGHPTTLAFYPVSVRRVRTVVIGFHRHPQRRLIPPYVGHPCLDGRFLPTGSGGLAPLRHMSCLAHERGMLQTMQRPPQVAFIDPTRLSCSQCPAAGSPLCRPPSKTVSRQDDEGINLRSSLPLCFSPDNTCYVL